MKLAVRLKVSPIMEQLPLSATTVVQLLLQFHVEERSGDELKIYEVEGSKQEAFRLKVKLYRQAILLMLLEEKSRTSEIFDRIRFAYEYKMFAVRGPFDFVVKRAFTEAIEQMQRLLNRPSSEGPFAWSVDWFRSIECTAPDPVAALSFAEYWKKEYAEFERGVEEYGSVE